MVEPLVTKFCVIYDGEDHVNHEMDIMTLGRSLSALGNALLDTNEIINGDRSSIDIKVDAEFIEGSFGFSIELIQSTLEAKDILSVLGFVGASAGAVTAATVISWLKGQKITLIESKDNEIDRIKIGKDFIDCPKDVTKLVTDTKIRKSLDDMIRVPLINKGTSTVSFKKDPSDKSAQFSVDKTGAKAFVKLTVKESSNSDEREAIIKFIAANIKTKSGWKIELDGQELTVKMEDEMFLERLNNMEEAHVFGKRFNVMLKIITKKSFGTESKSYVIKRVHYESKSK